MRRQQNAPGFVNQLYRSSKINALCHSLPYAQPANVPDTAPSVSAGQYPK
jgi:hypothetical protein